jgi:hypothetical protein
MPTFFYGSSRVSSGYSMAAADNPLLLASVAAVESRGIDQVRWLRPWFAM